MGTLEDVNTGNVTSGYIGNITDMLRSVYILSTAGRLGVSI
jgi:hypothetical protein